MRFERLWTATKSLRFRLALWNGLAVALTATVTILAFRIGLEWTLLHETDQVLRDDVAEIALLADEAKFDDPGFREQLERKAQGHIHHRWFVQLFEPSGEVLWATSVQPENFPAISSLPRSTPTTIAGFRGLRGTIPYRANRQLDIFVASSLEFVDEDLARIDRIAMLAASAILLVAPLGGYWLAGRATRPLNEIIQTADRIQPDNMTKRLAIRGVGDELDHLAETINRLLDRIARHLEHNRAFVADAAHELRSPLAAIQSSAEVTLAQTRSKADYEEFIQDTIEQTDSLTKLVNQLLIIAETETGRMSTGAELVSLTDLVKRTVDMFHAVAESKSVNLRWTALEDIQVRANPRHLRQVLNNLIDNAIKFTSEQGTVSVTIQPINRGRVAEISVRDNGIGITAEDLPRIFDRFYRGDKSHRRNNGTTGTGLGLSICQAIVAALGGSLTVNSTFGEGSTFTVTLPTSSERPAINDLAKNSAG